MTQIFVNLPVRDLPRSVAFYTQLGYAFDPRFTDEKGTCMVVADNIFVMLLTTEFFQTFIDKPVADTSRSAGAILCISAESRADVDALIGKAAAAGARLPRDAKDYGFMYQHAYEDPDGHLWEIVHLSGEPPVDA